MHTPDGFITSWICAAMLLASALPLAWAACDWRKWLTAQMLPRMALLACIIFLLQMLNFPIASGTSGHFIGAALAAILLGPEAALIVMAAVLATQTLVFGDGGMLSLGVNIFNMSVVGVYGAHYSYRALSAKLPASHAAFLSSWFSVLVSSISASVLLSLSNLAPSSAIFAGMLSTHAIICIGEGIISIGALAALSSKAKNIGFATAASYAAIALALASVALPFASGSPDGLARVSIDLGFYSAATQIWGAPIQNYPLSFLPAAFGAAGAAALGAAITFGIFAFPNAFASVRLAASKTKC